MAFSESLALRIRSAIHGRRGITEKRMFGGLCCMLHGNLLVAILKDSLIVRVGPEAYSEALTRDCVSEFDFTGRPMKGWVVVHPDGIDSDRELSAWIDAAWQFVRTLPPK